MPIPLVTITSVADVVVLTEVVAVLSERFCVIVMQFEIDPNRAPVHKK